MVPEVNQGFWAALARGEFLTDAAAVAGTNRWRGLKWVRAAGGVRPRRGRDLKGRCLTFSEREEIALTRAGGESIRSIARRLGAHRRRSAASLNATQTVAATPTRTPTGCYASTSPRGLTSAP